VKAGVPDSRRRREESKALEEAKAPAEKPEAVKTSLLARLLRTPNATNAQALVKAASGGELTSHDMQAGLAALLASSAEQARKTGRAKKVVRGGPEEIQRAYIVLQKQLIEGLKDVVLSTPSSGGPVCVVELHWPAEWAPLDPGEAVRTKVPEELEV
jgi:hypothetical protein